MEISVLFFCHEMSLKIHLNKKRKGSRYLYFTVIMTQVSIRHKYGVRLYFRGCGKIAKNRHLYIKKFQLTRENSEFKA